MSCGPDPCARSSALGELSLHEPLRLSLCCPQGTGVWGEAPSCLSALPPSLVALPRDPQPCAEADHGDQHHLPAPAGCKRRSRHTRASRCSSRCLLIYQGVSPLHSPSAPLGRMGVCSHKKGKAHWGAQASPSLSHSCVCDLPGVPCVAPGTRLPPRARGLS